MKPCISEATTLPATFAEDVEAYASGGCTAMEVWLTKLEQHLESHSAADTRKLLEDRQMTLAGASYQGGLLLSQGEERRAHYDHFRRRLDLCQAFSIPTLLVVADFVAAVDRTDLERAVVSLKQAAQWAAAFLLTPANLAFVQLSDLSGVPRELATDADRVLPGDGDFQLEPVLQQLRTLGYDGWVSLELMNPMLWNTKASQVAELGIMALQRLLGTNGEV
jgi:sugar phosphate isomerase/epimerase